MTGIDLAAWIAEQRDNIIGARIVNVYHVPPDIVVIKLRTRLGENKLLLIQAACRLHITRRSYEKESKMTSFAGALRKCIRDGIIEDIEQVGLDRICVLKVRAHGERFKLIAELLPRGDIVVVNSDDTILYALHYTEMKDRAIKRGEKYIPPPRLAEDPTSLAPQELLEKISRGKDVVRGLVLGLGIPGEVAEEVLHRAGVEKHKAPSELTIEEADRILSELKELIEKIKSGHLEPCIVKSSGTPISVLPFKPSSVDGEVEAYTSFNEALDAYFSVLAEARAEKIAEEVEKEASKIKAAMEKQEQQAKFYEKLAEEYRKIADELSAKAHLLEAFIEKAKRLIEEGRIDELKQMKGVVNVNPRERKVTVKIGEIQVELDLNESAFQNISRIYAKAKELQRKAEKAWSSKKELEEKLAKLEEEVRRRIARARGKLRPKEWYEKYHWLVTSEGFLAIGGRDASQNESVVKKYLGDRDIFMHADVHGAPAVVIITQGREPSSKSLEEAAILAACYSKAWKLGAGYVDVYWAWGSQVSKTPPPGEYLGKGAFMVYGKRNYIRGVQLRLALGIEEYGEAGRVIVGPEDLVARRAKAYVVIAPGDEKPMELARRIKKLLEKKHPDLVELIESVPEEEIAQRLPGPSTIVKVA